MELTHYLKAGYPALHVVTQEPLRAISSIKAEGWKSFAWDCLSLPPHSLQVTAHCLKSVDRGPPSSVRVQAAMRYSPF